METLQLRGRWTGGNPGLGLTLSELFPLNLPPTYATVTGGASHPGLKPDCDNHLNAFLFRAVKNKVN